MSSDEKQPFLARWSRRKLQKTEEAAAPPAPAASVAPPLPPVEKLTPESDFSGFMHPKVEDTLRRVALKKLFSDPHFNTPDPFEPYSIDLSVAESIPEEMLASLEQVKTMLRKPPQEHAATQEKAQAEEEAKPDEPGRQDA
ncbi:MAG: DUF3306 domain-containing protein [Betaproteobacteria bacterium]